MSAVTQAPDSSLIRDIVAKLTQRPVAVYVPGGIKKPWKCPHCKRPFASGALRVHIPRCESKPVKVRVSYNERVLGATRMTAHEYAAYLVESGQAR